VPVFFSALVSYYQRPSCPMTASGGKRRVEGSNR
jgi:hypothetical protein